MPSALNALPTITGTALGASLATGTVAGQFKAPTAVTGFMVPMDSLNFYVQAQDVSGAIVIANATANGSANSGFNTNTWHKGASFYIAVASVTVNSVTIGLTLNGINANDSLAYPLARVSLDGIVASGRYGIQFYPGLVQSGATGQNFAQTSGMLPAVFSVTSSLTVTTTASMTGTVSYQISMSKTL